MPIDPSAFVKEAQEFQENLRKAAEQTKDVKEGKCTAEDEMAEPAYRLYNSIAESTVQILQNSVVQRGLVQIGQALGEEVMKAFVQILTVCMTYSAHEAVIFYDEMLKKELDGQFDHFAQALNNIGAMATAHDGVLQVHGKRIQTLENEKTKEAAGA